MIASSHFHNQNLRQFLQFFQHLNLIYFLVIYEQVKFILKENDILSYTFSCHVMLHTVRNTESLDTTWRGYTYTNLEK
jgi:hypothetical protein